MNPYLSGGGKELEASSIVIEALARYDPDGNLVPWLVDKISRLSKTVGCPTI
ncbi:MAG: hypothetical protein Ct9H300mP16_13280 [Pseudomonadota bacterium]|nr:MAG: hypothetical protein Ct9H300mP16_13280 [Pseudomonadota bacterium]